MFDCRFCADFCTRCLFVRFVLCARAFLFYFSPFSASLLPLKNFFICRSGRDGASTFFRKESRQRFAKGLRPFEPHACALRPIFSFSALLAGLRGLSAANRRLTGKRLKSQGAELSFSSVSVRRGTPALCGQSPPFFSLLAGLHGPSGRKSPADKGNARKAKGAELSFSGVSVRGGTGGPTFCVFMEVWRGLPPGYREQGPGFLFARENRSSARARTRNQPRARLGAGTNRVRDLPGAAARLAHRRCARIFHMVWSPAGRVRMVQ